MAGFFVGNEAITTGNGSVTSPYIKAAARDMKAYRDKKGYRNIPIGYSAADIASLRPMLQDYLSCGSNTSERIDFFALNAYSWCGDSSYQQAGYDNLEKNAKDLPVPIFMSETGCNTVRPRDFKDQEALFGEMADVWSGSIIYEWIEEQNNYGLISYGPKVDPSSPNAPPDGFPRSGMFGKEPKKKYHKHLLITPGKPTPVEPDFPNLSAVWKTLNPTGIKASDYRPTQTSIACPAFTKGAWEVVPTSVLPTLGQKHNYDNNPTSASSGATQTPTSGGKGTASGSGAADPAATNSAGAATDGLGKELKSTAALLVGVFGVFAWL